jgi:hypothetical protein
VFIVTFQVPSALICLSFLALIPAKPDENPVKPDVLSGENRMKCPAKPDVLKSKSVG